MNHRTALRALALTAALLTTAFVGVALAKTFTLKEAKNAAVTNQSSKTTKTTIVVNSKGHSVYILTGDSAKHPECNNSMCWQFWPPVKVKSTKGLSAATGIKGKLGTWKHHGFLQLTIAGHPLYTFAPDTKRDTATGEGVLFPHGAVWHVRTPSGKTVSFATTSNTGSGGGGW